MRLAFPVALALMLCCALVGSTSAQCTPGAGVVELTINGTVGIGQTVAAQMPGTLDISLTDTVAPGNAFILLAGYAGISCNLIPLVWGGSIDVAAPAIIANGLTPVSIFDFMALTDFTISVPTACASAGLTGPTLRRAADRHRRAAPRTRLCRCACGCGGLA